MQTRAMVLKDLDFINQVEQTLSDLNGVNMTPDDW